MANIYSMTGFGKSVVSNPSKKLTVEVKSLNSKQADINFRIPSMYREKEADLRYKVVEMLERGKIDVSIQCEIIGTEKAPKLNLPLIQAYLDQLSTLKRHSHAEDGALSSILRFPDVLNSEDELDQEEINLLLKATTEALERLQDFRQKEGSKLQADLSSRLDAIEENLTKVPAHEEERMEAVKQRLRKNIEGLEDKVDENRFEQELIYYLEKLDINEEKVRLKTHLDYFRQVMDKGGAVGKKLGFISQEIGREINTMGSKANHAAIQKLVVQMKDELEKIKEQTLNIL